MGKVLSDTVVGLVPAGKYTLVAGRGVGCGESNDTVVGLVTAGKHTLVAGRGVGCGIVVIQ